jgi:hypothetical protein
MVPSMGWGIATSMYTLNHVDPTTTIIAVCKLRVYLAQVFGIAYRWSLTAACVDRYLISSDIARLRNFARVHIAHRVIGFLVIVSITFPVHTLILYSIKASVCGIFYDTAAALYHALFTIAMSCVFPSSIMFSCALLIRRNLAIKRQRRQHIVTQQRERTDEVENVTHARDQQVLAMLFTQISVYVISVIPLMAIYTYNAATLHISNKSVNRINIEKFAFFMAEVMIYIFPASSFYLYTISSSTFRNELIRLLRSPFGCRWLINTHGIEPITNDIKLRRAPGLVSPPVEVPESHVPDQVLVKGVSKEM